MKCWCFNEEQLRRALDLYAQHRNAHGSLEIIGLTRDIETIEQFLSSDAARESKLLMDGIWDRKDPAPVVATPTGALDPKHEAEGRN